VTLFRNECTGILKSNCIRFPIGVAVALPTELAFAFEIKMRALWSAD